jgi:hypothetical protein
MKDYGVHDIDLPLLKSQTIQLAELLTNPLTPNLDTIEDLWGVVNLLENISDHMEDTK